MSTKAICLTIVVAVAATFCLHAQTQIDLRTQSKSVDFSSASSTKPIRMGSSVPVACSLGEMFLLSVAVSGQNLYLCTSTNTWTLLGAGSVTNNTGSLPSNYPVLGAGGSDIKAGGRTGSGNEVVMSQSPTIVTPVINSFSNAQHNHADAAGGGLLTASAMISSSKQGTGAKFQMFGGGPWIAGDCAQFDASGNLVSASVGCGGAGGGEANTGQNIGTGSFFWFKQKVGTALQFKSFSAGSRISIAEAADTITFNVNEGALDLANLGGALPAAKLASGIDAVKLGSGTVNNTKFGYLANLTSDIQTQLNAKASTSHSHTAGGDATGDLTNLTITRLQGRTIASAAPAAGQVLTWNATAGQWEPQVVSTGAPTGVSSFNGRTGAVVPATSDYSFAQISGSVAPAQLAGGIDVTKLASGAVNNTRFGYLANVTSDIQTQFNSKAASSHSHSSGGDLSGDIAAATVTGLRNRSLSLTAPANGQVLTWNSTISLWEPQTPPGAGGFSGVTSFNGRTGAVAAQSGDYSFGQLSGSLDVSQIPTGIDAAKIGSGTVSNTKFGYLAGLTSDVQTQLNSKAAAGHSHTAGGDASGDFNNLTVTKLQGRIVASALPSAGQVLTWNAIASQWEPQLASSGVSSFNGRTGSVTPASSDYSFAQISGSVAPSQLASGIDALKLGSGAVNNTKLGYLANVTADLQSQLDGKAPTSHSHTSGGDLSGDVTSATVTRLRNRSLSVTAPANGQVLTWNSTSSQWEPQTPSAGSSGVTSFSGRTGAVAPQSGDYSFSQISGSVDTAQLPSGIDATKLGAGTVSNTKFGYLANVTSDIQSQFASKADSSHAHSAGGDATGDLAALSVVRLRNRTVAATAPQNGQALVWNSSTSQWEPQNQTGAGTNATQIQGRNVATTAPGDGQVLSWSAAQNTWLPGTAAGGGAGHTSQLTDLAVVRTSSTTLSIGASCSVSTPCKVRFGSNTIRVTQGATATLTSGAGTAKVFLTSDGSIRVGYPATMAVTCADCTAVTPLVGFPPNAVPLWDWLADAGTWQPAGGTDLRAFLGVESINFGTGLISSQAGGSTLVALDSAVVGLRVAVPASSSATCNPGEWAVDTSYTYFCVAPATWRRAPLSSW